MIFYLGTHMVPFLYKTDIALFLSRRRLFKRRTFPRALGRWALDSGAFSEIAQYHQWTITAKHYLSEVRRYAEEIGNLDWAAPMDWMCEPDMLEKTGKTVEEHQQLTTENFLELQSIGSVVPIIPALQGWVNDDYYRHVDLYLKYGVDLSKQPIVGLGSVCRRHHTAPVHSMVRRLARQGINLHGFGFKKSGLPAIHEHLWSSDSLAWSFDARYTDPLEGCTHGNCANCLFYALKWRDELLRSLKTTKRQGRRSNRQTNKNWSYQQWKSHYQNEN